MSDELHLERKPLSISPITQENVKEVARIHAEIFPDYFLTRLGLKTLELFYREFVDNPEAFGFVAVSESQVVGFVAGLTNSSNFYRAFYKKSFGNLLLATIASSVRDRSFMRQLGSRGQHISYAILSRLGIGKKKISLPAQSQASARLLSIGILPSARGSGAADALVDRLGQEFSLRGIKVMGLSVFPDNPRAIAFYEKNGWQCELKTETGLYFIKPTISPVVAPTE